MDLTVCAAQAMNCFRWFGPIWWTGSFSSLKRTGSNNFWLLVHMLVHILDACICLCMNLECVCWPGLLVAFCPPKGAEEQFSLFGEVCPDTCRFLLCQDEDVSVGGRRRSRKSLDSPVPMEMDSLFDMDVLMSEFSDTLFSTLASHQPVAWPNPREIGEKWQSKSALLTCLFKSKMNWL